MDKDIIYDNYWERCMELQKKNDELIQYACDLEDKICYLNGDIKRINNNWNKLKNILMEGIDKATKEFDFDKVYIMFEIFTEIKIMEGNKNG